MKVIMEQWWNDNDKEKPKNEEKMCVRTTLSTTPYRLAQDRTRASAEDLQNEINSHYT